MTNFKRIITLIITTTPLAFASETDPKGGYIGANIGYANVNDWWSAGLALTIDGGYNFNEYMALDAGVTWINPIVSNARSGTYLQNQSFADIAAKVTLPLSNIFNVYAKGGLGVGYSSSSIGMSQGLTAYNWQGSSADFNYGLYMALGGELKLSRAWELTFDDYGIMPVIGNSWGNINVFGFGVKYNF